MDRLTFVVPTLAHKAEAWAYRQEHIDNGEQWIHGSGGLHKASNYESWLTKITDAQTASQTGWVDCSTYFAVVAGAIVGTLQIRHTLNEGLLETGGHIGYGVRPAQRQKGYATQMLATALQKCRALGITRALVTCDKPNTPSAKTILRNGGKLENEVIEPDGNIVQRYWIEV